MLPVGFLFVLRHHLTRSRREQTFGGLALRSHGNAARRRRPETASRWQRAVLRPPLQQTLHRKPRDESRTLGETSASGGPRYRQHHRRRKQPGTRQIRARRCYGDRRHPDRFAETEPRLRSATSQVRRRYRRRYGRNY